MLPSQPCNTSSLNDLPGSFPTNLFDGQGSEEGRADSFCTPEDVDGIGDDVDDDEGVGRRRVGLDGVAMGRGAALVAAGGVVLDDVANFFVLEDVVGVTSSGLAAADALTLTSVSPFRSASRRPLLSAA